MRHARFASLLLLMAACATAPAAEERENPATATEAAEQATFTISSGTTTVVTEQFRRTPSSLEAEFSIPNGGRVSYTAQLRPDASVSRIELRQYARGAAADAAPVNRSTGEFRGDSVYLTQQRGDSAQTAQRAAPAGSVPYVNPSPSLLEQIVRRARAIGGTEVSVPVWIPGGGGQTATATVRFSGADSANVTLATTQIVLRVDGRGKVLGGAVPSQGLTLTRSN